MVVCTLLNENFVQMLNIKTSFWLLDGIHSKNMSNGKRLSNLSEGC
jgi:hypothetical protein